MHSTFFDRVDLNDKLEGLADKYLTQLSDESISIFVREAKRIVDNAFDDFIIKQEDIYTNDSIRGIQDKQQLLAFSDIQKGYRSQMQDWIEKNPIEVKAEKIAIDDLVERIPLRERESFKRSASVLGIGSIVVLGLRIITSSTWIYLAELAVLALASGAYAKGKAADDKKLSQLRHQRMKQIKTNVIENIRQELNQWIDLAESEHKRILKTFNIETL